MITYITVGSCFNDIDLKMIMYDELVIMTMYRSYGNIYIGLYMDNKWYNSWWQKLVNVD